MSWFKRTTSSVSIGLGCFLMLAGIHSFNDRTTFAEERMSDGLACMLLGAPLLGWGAWSKRHLRLHHQQVEQERLRSILFGLLQQSEVITVLRFAMVANIPGEVAKQFLDRQAQLFAADYEVDDRGGIRYRFEQYGIKSTEALPEYDA